MKQKALLAVLKEYHERLNFYAGGLKDDHTMRKSLQAAASSLKAAIDRLKDRRRSQARSAAT
jgi:hypothetical protein